MPMAQRLICLVLLLLALPAPAAISLEDDEGHRITLAQPARRIVALAPHIAEVVFAAGAGSHLAGTVQYSDYPEAAKDVPRVGSYNAVNMEAVVALKPDLVLAWKSGNREAHLERFTALGIPVFVSEPRTLEDVARTLETYGILAGTETAAQAAAQAFRQRRDALSARYARQAPVPVFYQIWDRPLMTINGAHLISDVMRLCAGRNVFADLPQIAPVISAESVLAANPEVIVASGMGEARPEWLDQWQRWPDLLAARRGNLSFIPPDLMQRHTPRLLDGAERLCAALETARQRRSAKGAP